MDCELTLLPAQPNSDKLNQTEVGKVIIYSYIYECNIYINHIIDATQKNSVRITYSDLKAALNETHQKYFNIQR
jgi:hypothetical protein